MKISKITTQKKNNHRYNIFLQKGSTEEYAFSVDEDVLIKFHLRKGLSLTDELIEEITSEDHKQKAYNKVIRYLSYRMRTEKEIREYLQKEDLFPEHVDEIIAKLEKNNLVDDLEFAKMFVRSRINTSNKGPGLIRKELEVKGIHDENIDEALSQFSTEEQEEKALQLVQKRLARTSKHSFQKQLNQAKAALMRNGYSSRLIRSVINEVRDMQDDEAEWEAIIHHGERLERRFSGKFADAELRQKIKEGLYRQGFHLSLIHEYLQTR